MRRRRRTLALWALFVGLALGACFAFWANANLAPMPYGKAMYVRFAEKTPLRDALDRLEARGVVRSSVALSLFSRIKRYPQTVMAGTYRVRPGMESKQILDAIRLPVRQMVRLPETNWASRSANLLEKAGVAKAAEYMALVRDPAAFAGRVPFPLPKSGSLEGYLYPDTYDLPPLLGAKGVVERQLKAFETKVWVGLDEPKNLRRVLIIASLVQMEVAKDEERPIVAGIIENRLSKKMPLQIDAAVLYGMGKWKSPTRADIANTVSPYNTYKHTGLPPGPICSPSLASIRAALNPKKSDFLYYVALPNGHHLFAATYEQHLYNVSLRRKAMAGAKP